jgi:hypothetical protein
MRQLRGYPANVITDENESVGPSTKVNFHVAFILYHLQSFFSVTKVYGKQELTYRQALSSPDAAKWEAAIKDEYLSLIKNETWELAPLPPPNSKAIKCKWVFDIKQGYEGVDERYKARLVALGCSQIPGLDF